MIAKKYILLFLMAQVMLWSCSIKKNLPQQSKIYGGSKIVFFYDKADNQTLKEDLQIQVEGLIQPKENARVFGYPYKVGNYYLFNADKKKKGKFISSLVEKPVFFQEKIISKNEKNISDYLITRGYFEAQVDGISTVKKITHSAKYFIKMGLRYRIDTLIISKDTNNQFQKDFSSTLQDVQLGTYFDLDVIKTERQKIENAMRQKGYYAFRPDYIEFIADTLGLKQGMKVSIKLKLNTPETAKKQYQINDIFVNIDEKPVINTSEETDFFRGLILDDKNSKYNPSLFSDAIAFRPGTLFDSRLQSISSNRLIGLSNFKLVNSSFQIVNRLDSTLIDSYYYLQTMKAKSFRAEANAISRSSGLAGTQFSINWQNINTFKGAENLKITARTNLEVQLGGKKANSLYTNNYRIGFEAALSLPRFWAPRIKIDPEVSKVLPKTQIAVGWESFIKTDLYNLNSANASLNYTWTRGRGVEHSLKPFTLRLIRSSNISSVFLDEIFTDPKLLVILENQFISGGSYAISVLPKTTVKGQYSYNGSIDFAGNSLALFDAIRNKPALKGKVFGEYFSQFVRLENEFRYRRDFSRKASLANRAFVGIGLPYGNSLQLPFTSQFYVGGNNSLRAFRARGVGPGAYKRTGSVSETFLGNNTGDIKLEFNTELRYKLNSFIGTAIFLDAGNVWMSKDSYIYGKEALFSKNFIRQMALGTGLGFRFDFTFIILRLDIGTPLYIPSEDQGKKWVIEQFSPVKKAWRKENLVWNIAIGLPF
jgi:outer membrane protein assembly factor BamA